MLATDPITSSISTAFAAWQNAAKDRDTAVDHRIELVAALYPDGLQSDAAIADYLDQVGAYALALELRARTRIRQAAVAKVAPGLLPRFVVKVGNRYAATKGRWADTIGGAEIFYGKTRAELELAEYVEAGNENAELVSI